MSKTKEVTIEQYREKLSKVCDRASASTQKWLEKHPNATRQEILDAAYKITQAYGLAASTLAANKYDQDVALAEKQGYLKPGQIKEAVAWDDPLGYGEIARAINGTLKNNSKDKLPDTVGRMVKSYAEDTTLLNANRDGAEYAWIPAGDTCVFCLSLASNGWQRASRSTAQGNHADHIHPHCDCTFSVRFSKDTNVKGYHPEKIKASIETCEGDTWTDKLKSFRRKIYEERNRELLLGNSKSFERDRKIVTAKSIKKFSNNNLYLSNDVKLNKNEVRWMNRRISKAKELLGIDLQCDIPIVIVKDDFNLATYNPHTNVMFVSSKMANEKEVLKLQEFFAAPDNPNSTMVHELLHWKDAEEYRKSGKIIDSADEKSEYSNYQRESAIKELKNNGIDISDDNQIMQISHYAYLQALANNYEEVYTEYRTKAILEK